MRTRLKTSALALELTLALSLTGGLAGCATPAAGSFSPADADRVVNGMTREQVVAIMGSQPAWARADGRTLA